MYCECPTDASYLSYRRSQKASLVYDMAEKRSQVVYVRVTPTEKRLIERAAEADHLQASSWVRSLVLREIERKAAESKRK